MTTELDRDLQSIQEVRRLAAAAQTAAEQLARMSQRQLDAICQAVSACGAQHAAQLGRQAAQETGFGNAHDKEIKNRFAAETVWNAIRDMPTVGILHRDRERKIIDVGVPVGVIAGIVPSTNPTSTIIYKALIALKSGNAIVFSPHPGAAACSCETARLLAGAAKQAGCPDGAIGCISIPTQQGTQELMRHDAVCLILATGGGAMVHAAYSSGKPAIGVGAGNGPAYIHKSADISKAVSDILASKTFDNGTICASEQSVITERCCTARVREELQRQGGYFLSSQQARQLEKLLLRPNGTMNPKIVGKTAQELAKLAGIEGVGPEARVLIAREDEAGPARPYSREKLCPVLAFFEAEDEDEVLRRICQVLALEGSGHTFAIHANDEAVIEKFALQVPVSRFLVNTPAALGGIGATTGLFPALTLGCGAVGGSSSSNNISPLDLINIRRVAWGLRDIPGESGQAKPSQPPLDESLVDRLTEQIMKKLL